MREKNKLVYGWGINDVDYIVCKTKVIDGKQKQVWVCPYYKYWRTLLQRCLDVKALEKRPNYKDCTIYEDWRYLSNFIKWVDSQPNKDWQNCQLDKDFLVKGNKYYSPETVVFITQSLNGFITNCGKSRGDYLLGVCYLQKQHKNPYQANCSNPFTNKYEYLGIHPTELEAHKAWQARKHEHALKLADMQDDERVVNRLRDMYAPDKDWTKS